jgi:hypothetical protein
VRSRVPGEQKLYDAAEEVQDMVGELGKAYAPTKKYPTLATARCPQQMVEVLTSLRAAVSALRAESASDRDPSELDGLVGDLQNLESRICRTPSAQVTRLTPADIAEAIRSDPAVRAAAAAALEASAQ